MKYVDRICAIIGALGVALLVGTGVYMAFMLTFGLGDFPEPPRTLWAGLVLVLSAFVGYIGAHIISGELN